MDISRHLSGKPNWLRSRFVGDSLGEFPTSIETHGLHGGCADLCEGSHGKQDESGGCREFDSPVSMFHGSLL